MSYFSSLKIENFQENGPIIESFDCDEVLFNEPTIGSVTLFNPEILRI